MLLNDSFFTDSVSFALFGASILLTSLTAFFSLFESHSKIQLKSLILFLLWNIHSIPWLCGYSPIRCWNMYWSGWLEAHSLKHKNPLQSFIKALLKILYNYYKCWILCHFFSPVVAGQSCWQHDEHRILSAFLYFSPLSYSLLPYYQFCCLFFLSIFIVLRWVVFSGVVFFPLFFWLPNSTVAQLECQSKSISI